MTATLDLFKYQTMLQTLEQAKPPKTFIRNNFFSSIEQSTTEQVLIDVYDGVRRTAIYVRPSSVARVVDRVGYKTNTYTPPYVKEKIPTRAEDFLTRLPGDTIMGVNDSPQQRAARRLGEDLITLDDMISRLEELQCAKLIDTGAYTVIGDGVNDTIDFGMAAGHKITLAGADLWTDAASTPVDDLKAWKRLIAKDSGMTATDVIMGEDAIDAFLNNAQVKAQNNLWRQSHGEIDMVANYGAMDSGVTYYGNYAGLNIWTYDEWYIDPATGTETAMIPAKKVIVLAKNMRSARHYGAIRDLRANFAVPRFPKSWEEEDPSVRWLMLQSAPMMALHQVGAVVSVQVLA